MGSLAYYRVVILLVCVGSLSLQPNKVSGLRSMDLALRWGVKDLHIVKAVDVQDLQTKQSPAPEPSVSFDPDQSEKRRVRRGSDPIHNRC